MSRKSRRAAEAQKTGEIARLEQNAGSTAEGAPESIFSDPRVRRWLPCVMIVILTFLFLSPVLRGIYIWDDPEWLTHNPLVITPGHLGDIWTDPPASPQYYPLVFTTFWIEYRIWGLGVPGTDGLLRGVGYHVDNLLLHALSAVLIYEILKRLRLPGGNVGAWLSAAIFAIHPVNVESVAWVAERKNTLCSVFFFTALWAGLRFFRVTQNSGDGVEIEQPREWEWKWYWLALVLFIAAMFSKTTAAVLPPVFLLLIWWRRGRIGWREILLALPFFAVGILMGALTSFLEVHEAGTSGADWQFSLLQRVLIAGTDLWFYMGKLLVPYPVMQVYPRFNIVAGRPVTDAWYFAAPVLYLALVGVLFGLRKRISRGPVTAVLFFAGVLLPALGFINFYTMTFTFVADHYQYLACIGIIVLLVELLLAGLKWLSARVPAKAGEDAAATRARFLRLTMVMAGGGMLLALGVLSFGVSELYTDGDALWGFNAEYNPQSLVPWENRASALLNIKPQNLEGAKAAMEKAAEVAPDDFHVWLALGSFYLEAGNGAKDAGVKGLMYLEKAEAVMPARIKAGRPAFLAARSKFVGGGLWGGHFLVTYGPHYQVGKFYEGRREWQKAIEQYQQDQREFPNNVETYFNLGNCYMGLNDSKDALGWFQQAIAKQPQYAAAWFSSAVCLYDIGDRKSGDDAVRRAFELNPKVAEEYPQFTQLLQQRLQKR